MENNAIYSCSHLFQQVLGTATVKVSEQMQRKAKQQQGTQRCWFGCQISNHCCGYEQRIHSFFQQICVQMRMLRKGGGEEKMKSLNMLLPLG